MQSHHNLLRRSCRWHIDSKLSHRKLPPYRLIIYSTVLRRYNTTPAATPSVPAQKATFSAHEPKPQPFAIERVGGRDQQLSWLPQGGISKQWQDKQPTGGSSGPQSTMSGKLVSWFKQMFLPTNYPHSVHSSYAPYHILQFAETVFGTVVTVLCNQALLTSVGFSAEGSLFGAVAVQWIIKDGAGEIAKLFFIRHFSPYFDSHPKTFSLISEGAVLVGSGLQIASLLLSPTAGNFLLCAAGGNIFKLMGQAIWLTTHIKFVRYFSQQSNTGDVAAKAESQASVAQLIGYGCGIGLLSLSHSVGYLYAVFFLTMPSHLAVTTYMLRYATFELLTLPRLSLLARGFVKDGEEKKDITTLSQLDDSKQTGAFGEFFKRKTDKFFVLAPPLTETVSSNSFEGRSRWDACATAFQNQNYLLYPSTSPDEPISIFFAQEATFDDMIKSILHAARLKDVLSQASSPDSSLHGALDETLKWTGVNFPEFRLQLREKGWRMDEIGFADFGRRVNWKREVPEPETPEDPTQLD